MKLYSALLPLLSLFLTSPVIAEVKLPDGVYRMSQLEEAMNAAGKEKKPLFFVCADEDASNKESSEILLETLKAGEKWAVPVFLTPKESPALPPPVMTSVDGGGTHPIVVISSPEGDKIWKRVTDTSPKTKKEIREAVSAGIRDCKGEINKCFATKTPPAPVLPGDTLLHWGMVDSNGFTEGIFGQVRNDGLYFRGQEGPGANYLPLDVLRPAGRRYLRYITGTAEAKKDATPVAARPEKWTNKQGKPLEAAFVSLKDGKVTLRTAVGKEHTLALDTLSEESQKRARELAGEAKKPQ